ncbi:efflux transporter outer membrane subunit [Pararhodospirillum oryzae]|uniref:Membrane protein n=1 Tax=Pararhodospirillum oryzae TaxID=478448 RepID=A0A512HB12_9PROT|nr:efflux transporter outer membrane subunit [Pararhodospirillum oryzae]GEO82634.1 membrane protein [Pararhodospirillum oryzae]
MSRTSQKTPFNHLGPMAAVAGPLFPLRALLAPVVLLAGLGACALGPDYEPPKAALPTQWSAPLPQSGRTGALINWWTRFNDPVLTRLLEKAEADSPSLAEAWANIASARATLGSDESAFFPQITTDASFKRTRQESMGMATIGNTLSGSLDASWEIDLFGKVRRTTEAAGARLQARIDDWHDARVSLAAEVADTYIQYRACRLLAQAYADEAGSQRQTAQALATSVAAGFTTPADGALAQASAASATATLTQQNAECDVLVKALSALTGLDDPALRTQLAQGPDRLPDPAGFQVAAVPAQALTQRPDLASLERELAAASAEIGAAQADRLPSLSLTGTVAKTGSSLQSMALSWGFGPALTLPLFDAGKRAAAVDSARATFDAKQARYENGLRTAVKEVEQALVRLDGAARRTDDARAAADGYRRYFEATNRNWQAGGASLLDREEARRNALGAEITLITVERDQIQYGIALYKALGGGWTPDAPARAPATTTPGGTR